MASGGCVARSGRNRARWTLPRFFILALRNWSRWIDVATRQEALTNLVHAEIMSPLLNWNIASEARGYGKFISVCNISLWCSEASFEFHHIFSPCYLINSVIKLRPPFIPQADGSRSVPSQAKSCICSPVAAASVALLCLSLATYLYHCCDYYLYCLSL